MQGQTSVFARNDRDASFAQAVIKEVLQILRHGSITAGSRLEGLLDRIERMP